MLELHAPAAPDADRPPLHLALVIDRSGSMEGGKLEAAIGGVYPRGATNISGGWLKGLEELNRAGGDATRRVLLLADGQANEGIVDPDGLHRIASGTKQRAATTTIGFGEGFDEDLLAAIAARSDGNTYFVESPEDAPGVFTEEFDGLASLVAQNVSVELRLTDDAVQLLGVLNDYPVTEVPGGLQVAVGDAYGDEVRRLVFALHIPEVAALGPAKVADVILRYVAVGDEITAHEVTVPVVVNLVSADEAATAGVDAEVTEEVWLLQAAKARRDAIAAADAGDHDGSRAIMRRASSAMRAAPGPGSARFDEFQAEADLLDAEVDASLAADPHWRKRMTDQAWRRTRGRPTK